jgi:hypothetical protein
LPAAELSAFKNGVAVMKSRPATDTTSWTYQAAIHGTFTTPVQKILAEKLRRSGEDPEFKKRYDRIATRGKV